MPKYFLMAPTTFTNPCATDILLHNVLINCAQVEEELKSWSIDDIMDGLLLLHVLLMPVRAQYAFDYYGSRRLLCTPKEIVRAW